jgi:hypothetical protein
MANHKRNTKVAALILEKELVVRENAVLSRMVDKLSLARKGGSKMTFAALLALA